MFDYFWSDPHFGHKNIITYCNRPFPDVKGMTDQLIENYNSTVEKDARVLWVGDAFFCSKTESKRIMDALNGRKFLVLGNHDSSSSRMLALGFESVVKEMVIEIADTPVRISHYPYLTDNVRADFRYAERRPVFKPGEVLIHGHTHSTEKLNGRMVHVGVDAWDYFPAGYHAVEAMVRIARENEDPEVIE